MKFTFEWFLSHDWSTCFTQKLNSPQLLNSKFKISEKSATATLPTVITMVEKDNDFINLLVHSSERSSTFQLKEFHELNLDVQKNSCNWNNLPF